jgi:hypothetical protein
MNDRSSAGFRPVPSRGDGYWPRPAATGRVTCRRRASTCVPLAHLKPFIIFLLPESRGNETRAVGGGPVRRAAWHVGTAPHATCGRPLPRRESRTLNPPFPSSFGNLFLRPRDDRALTRPAAADLRPSGTLSRREMGTLNPGFESRMYPSPCRDQLFFALAGRSAGAAGSGRDKAGSLSPDCHEVATFFHVYRYTEGAQP